MATGPPFLGSAQNTALAGNPLRDFDRTDYLKRYFGRQEGGILGRTTSMSEIKAVIAVTIPDSGISPFALRCLLSSLCRRTWEGRRRPS